MTETTAVTLPAAGDYIKVTNIPGIAGPGATQADIARHLSFDSIRHLPDGTFLFRVQGLEDGRPLIRRSNSTDENDTYYVNWEWPAIAASIPQVGDQVRLTSVPGWTMENFERSMAIAGTNIHPITRTRLTADGGTPMINNDGGDRGGLNGQPTAYFRIPYYNDSASYNSEFFATYEVIPTGANDAEPHFVAGDMFVRKAANRSLYIIKPQVPGDSPETVRLHIISLNDGRDFTDAVVGRQEDREYVRRNIEIGQTSGDNGWVRVNATDQRFTVAAGIAMAAATQAARAETMVAQERLRTFQTSDTAIRDAQIEILEALHDEATRRDWCSEYEAFLRRHGWEDMVAEREQDHEVSFVQISRRTRTVTVRAASADHIDIDMIAEAVGIDVEDIDDDSIDIEG